MIVGFAETARPGPPRYSHLRQPAGQAPTGRRQPVPWLSSIGASPHPSADPQPLRRPFAVRLSGPKLGLRLRYGASSLVAQITVIARIAKRISKARRAA